MEYSVNFPGGTVKYLFESRFEELTRLCEGRDTVLLVDSNVHELHTRMFKGYRVVAVEAREELKTLAEAERIVQEMLQMEARRDSMLVGVGGGITTDIAGFVASIYMRGIRFGFVPTSLLGMCDAAIGGKNGVNQGLQKNLVGTIRQPSFILYDNRFLESLPDEEWSNGFAEVIKYACLFDKRLFEELLEHDIHYYKNDRQALNKITERCAEWKNKIVMEDEQESGRRKLLNFGHTAGHAIETLYDMKHGYAVGIGMLIACRISEEVRGLDKGVRIQLKQLLGQYGLPVYADIEPRKVMDVLKMDKKGKSSGVDYIALEEIGKAVIEPVNFERIAQVIEKGVYASDS